LNVLLSVHGYKPAWRIGGPVVSVSSLAEALKAMGHEVTVFTTNSNLDQDLDVPTDREIEVDGVAVRYFRHEEPLKRLFLSFARMSQALCIASTISTRKGLSNAHMNDFDMLHPNLAFSYRVLAIARAAFHLD
jgi:nucleoside-diphosphate-sugar epimerase